MSSFTALVIAPIPDIHSFSSPLFHLSPCLWPRLGGTCQQKMLSERQLSGPLSPRLSSSSLSLGVFSRSRITSERQQKVSVLHLHVGAAFNKQSGSLTGHWEKASASVIWSNAPHFKQAFLLFQGSFATLAGWPIADSFKYPETYTFLTLRGSCLWGYVLC